MQYSSVLPRLLPIKVNNFVRLILKKEHLYFILSDRNKALIVLYYSNLFHYLQLSPHLSIPLQNLSYMQQLMSKFLMLFLYSSLWLKLVLNLNEIFPRIMDINHWVIVLCITKLRILLLGFNLIILKRSFLQHLIYSIWIIFYRLQRSYLNIWIP